MIRLEAVTKVYRTGATEVRALDGVSLDVPRGEFLSVTGPSGSGKSTLLQLLGGLDVPTAGEVTVDGGLLSLMSDDALTLFRRRHIGFVFQFFNLLPTLTAAENVALPLLLDGKRLADVRPWVAELLERVGLAHRTDHRPGQLSGGEMQRVAVARALVNEPVLVLADEPTGNLDSRTGDAVLGLLREATWRNGCTVVLVTHDRRAASRGDRLIRLEDGTIVDDSGAAGRSPRLRQANGGEARQ